MALTKERLLQKRCKVIGLYPGSIFEIGDILYKQIFGSPENGMYILTENFSDHGKCISIHDVETMPHLFQPLIWYSERKREDMPEYLKVFYKEGVQFHKVSQWLHQIGEQIVYEYEKDGLLFRDTARATEPASAKDYNEYIANLNKQ